MRKTKSKNGITLISLVITIIVLLILAAVAISMAVDSNGLFARARKATEDWNKSVGDETAAIENAMLIMNEVNGITVEIESITLQPTNLTIKTEEKATITATITPLNATDKTVTWQSENDQIATVTDNGNGTATVTGVKAGTTNIVAKAGEKEVKCSVEVELLLHNVTITKDNYKEYLGKVVTNFRPAGTGATEAVNSYTVGTKYRLYYVDFGDEEHPNGKYGDGTGTIYLKADCAGNNYTNFPSDGTAVDNTKMKQLNPELYKIKPPDEGYSSMKGAKYLLNPKNWEPLKTNSPIKDSVNYVVGAPSLELMIDSYNTYYEEEIKKDQSDLTKPDLSDITAGDRRKLFYQYTVGTAGYLVGPGRGKEYYHITSYNSVYTDTEIDEMYYPVNGHYYWLASPSAGSSYCLMIVASSDGGCINYHPRDDYSFALCPLVSLKPTVQLEFAE